MLDTRIRLVTHLAPMPEPTHRFRPVVVIPVYNHPDTVREVVAHMLKFRLPVIVVDDGSDTKTTQACADCGASDMVTVIHRKTNGGKGAALITGFQQAAIADFTHVITIDSDGQFDPNSVVSLLRLAKRYPDQVICGYPKDRSCLPRWRRMLRVVSNWAANLNALTFSIADAHCGLRLYPLAPVSQLLARIKPGRHMQFDPELLIRLSWLGVRVRNVPINMREPKDNISHYANVRDSLDIAWMHCHLFLTMLTRLPLIVMARFTGWHSIAKPASIKP